jgi:competence protein ComEA
MMIGRRQALLYISYGLLLALTITAVVLVATRRPAGFPVQLGGPPTPLPLRVDVEGAVVAPGVYTLIPGSILQDAVRAAGGPSAKGDISRLNLAHRLQDGDQVFVPELPSTRSPSATTGANGTTPGPSGTSDAYASTPDPSATSGANATVASTSATRRTKSSAPRSANSVNINTATAPELATLPHIGPALAQRIIDYRNTHGPFAAIADITLVRGIGQGIFALIKEFITVN